MQINYKLTENWRGGEESPARAACVLNLDFLFSQLFVPIQPLEPKDIVRVMLDIIMITAANTSLLVGHTYIEIKSYT